MKHYSAVWPRDAGTGARLCACSAILRALTIACSLALGSLPRACGRRAWRLSRILVGIGQAEPRPLGDRRSGPNSQLDLLLKRRYLDDRSAAPIIRRRFLLRHVSNHWRAHGVLDAPSLGGLFQIRLKFYLGNDACHAITDTGDGVDRRRGFSGRPANYTASAQPSGSERAAEGCRARPRSARPAGVCCA